MLAFFFAALATTSSIAERHGENDVVALGDVKSKDGQIIADRMLPFRQIDLRTKEDRERNVRTLRVVLIGCVKVPGVYEVKEGTTLEDLLAAAKLIRDHYPVRPASGRIQMYRKNEELRLLNTSKGDDVKIRLADGDVITVRAFIL